MPKWAWLVGLKNSAAARVRLTRPSAAAWRAWSQCSATTSHGGKPSSHTRRRWWPNRSSRTSVIGVDNCDTALTVRVTLRGLAVTVRVTLPDYAEGGGGGAAGRMRWRVRAL